MMKNNNQRNAMIHTSSIVSEIVPPFTALYAGTKKFNAVYGRLMEF